MVPGGAPRNTESVILDTTGSGRRSAELAAGAAHLASQVSGGTDDGDLGTSAAKEAEDFVTVILADFAPGEVRVVNCGHHPPVKVSGDPAEWQLMTPEQPAPPLGLQPRPARQDIALKPGDRLLFYTDGLVEARDHAGRFFDLGHPMVAAAIGQLVGLLLEHAGGRLADDVLLILGQPGVRDTNGRAEHTFLCGR
jgi:phosphoserine phosphatase RsbU/P